MKSPRRLRVTYNRHHGVVHMLAALDLTTEKIHYRIRRRKCHAELLNLLKTLRARWPNQRLHLVIDNFSPHRHPDIREWAADNDAELVELDRGRVRRLALLRPQRHRPPHPRRTGRRDRLVHPLAQRTSTARDRLRHRLTHPHLDPLPDQGCLTRQ